MVDRKNKTPISIKVKKGLDTDYQPFYMDWQTVYAKDISTSGRFNIMPYGVEKNFDKVIQVEANEVTRLIDEFTMLCVDVVPYNNYNEYGDYVVKQKFPESNGIIILGLEHRESASIPKLYYKYNNSIIQFDIDYDINTKTAYIKSGDYNPFDENSVIWEFEPASVDDVNDRIRLVSSESVGLDMYYMPFIKLTFGVVNG